MVESPCHHSVNTQQTSQWSQSGLEVSRDKHSPTQQQQQQQRSNINNNISKAATQQQQQQQQQ
eukprot:scaffold1842_cov145-Alexandrium_tamarense.AAC.1